MESVITDDTVISFYTDLRLKLERIAFTYKKDGIIDNFDCFYHVFDDGVDGIKLDITKLNLEFAVHDENEIDSVISEVYFIKDKCVRLAVSRSCKLHLLVPNFGCQFQKKDIKGLIFMPGERTKSALR